MPKGAVNEDLGIVLCFLRRGQGWSQVQLARAAKIPANLISDYEQGRKTLSRKRLEYLAAVMGLPPETIDGTLELLEMIRSSGGPASAGRLSATRRRIEAVSTFVGRMAADFSRSTLSIVAFESEAIEARAEARRIWEGLEPRPAEERLAVIEDSPEPPTWALCELVCAKSIEAAPNSPAEAMELADLALAIAERCPGAEWLRLRTRGYAWFHVANARRAANRFPASGAALDTARKLWDAGAHGDPGLFDEAIVRALEANIRKAQRRFPEALKRIGEALAADHGELRGKLLLTQAQILQSLGNLEESTEVLRKVIPYMDGERDPRTALGVLCQFVLNLCLQDRAMEAAPHHREAELLAERLGQEVDLVRVAALSGLIAAGLGQAEEAEDAFEQARRKFANFDPPLVFDYALMGLHLGLLLLEQNRTAEVRILAEQMKWIFRAQGVHREALAAVKLFCDAAKQETATVALARRVIRFLHWSEHDPDLKFEEAGIP